MVEVSEQQMFSLLYIQLIETAVVSNWLILWATPHITNSDNRYLQIIITQLHNFISAQTFAEPNFFVCCYILQKALMDLQEII